MATHDYVIANGTGAAVRSDLNNALAAIVSNNSSSSAPSTTYAYQFWADTNTNILKIRNSANNGWIKLRELDGTMLIDDGSVSTPGLAFGSDLNTGISRSASNKINFSTQGVERLEIGNSEVVVNDPSNDVDFRVESDGNTHMLFVNADTDRVGIGESSPNATLHVTTADSGVNPNASADELFVESDGNTGITIGSPAANTGRISFGDSADAQVGKILYDHSSNFLSFDTAGSERLRINNGGKVLVNTTAVLDSNAAAKLQVQADTGALLALGRDGTGVTSGDDIGKIAFYGNDAGAYQKCAMIKCEADGSHANDDKPSRLVFSIAGDGEGTTSEVARITSDGDWLVGKEGNNTNLANKGCSMTFTGKFLGTADGSSVININRLSSDGNLVQFYQATSLEGSISVSGSTVSYNGGHLTRWSQLASGAARTEILRGSVLSNLDEMCEWGEEDNEQLNRMKISDVEGDANVSGVFQAWDDDDDTYTNDFYCAMTGDFVIRIAQGTTVARGDLLMSAGDGTAKPQDDDIVRSKTIAKVTSTTVSTTYADGSYCVPCVLMAC
jgi:hypothetical protein